MSDAMALFLLAGAGITLIAFPVLFARRYPGRPGWVVLGAVIGLAALFVWPLTIWVALGMWLSGFAGPRRQPAQHPAPEGPQLGAQIAMARAYAQQAEIENMPNSAAYWHGEVQRLIARPPR
jgi:hypothetical protein